MCDEISWCVNQRFSRSIDCAARRVIDDPKSLLLLTKTLKELMAIYATISNGLRRLGGWREPSCPTRLSSKPHWEGAAVTKELGPQLGEVRIRDCELRGSEFSRHIRRLAGFWAPREPASRTRVLVDRPSAEAASGTLPARCVTCARGIVHRCKGRLGCARCQASHPSSA